MEAAHFLFTNNYTLRIASSILYIDLYSNCVCDIKLITESCNVSKFNIYCTCDTVSNEEYNDALSTISNCLRQYYVEHCVNAGEFNTNLSRVNSRNTISL